MNIFFLDKDPIEAARQYCDKHCIKIILEVAQMLSSAYPPGQSPYRHTHLNHPMSVWVRSNRGNFEWALRHGLALCREYTARYGRIHKTQEKLEWIQNNPPLLETGSFTNPPQCFGKYVECRSQDFVDGYRKYYQTAKRDIATWKNTQPPSWFKKA